jgi:hypothetical protein
MSYSEKRCPGRGMTHEGGLHLCVECAPKPPSREAGRDAEDLAGKIAEWVDRISYDEHEHYFNRTLLTRRILPILSEALAAASESDLHHAECKALIEEQRDALAARLREAEADPATPEPSVPPKPHAFVESVISGLCRVSVSDTSDCFKLAGDPIHRHSPERVVGEAGTVEKLTPLAREVFPMAAAIEAGTVGGKHAYQAGIYEAYYEDVCVICDQPASDPCHDPVHEVGR